MDRHIEQHNEIRYVPQKRGRPRGAVDKTPRQRPRELAHDSRLETVVALRLEGKTLKEIASNYGITKQAISLQLKKAGIVGPPTPRSVKQFAKKFARLVRQWLNEAGYKHCPGCATWKSIKDDFSPKGRHCRPCNATIATNQYRTNPNRKRYQKEYARSEKFKQYQRDYYQSKKKGIHHHVVELENRLESKWTECLSPDLCNRTVGRQQAHHGIFRVDFCRCGAFRLAEINGSHRNFLRWTLPV